MPLEFTKRTSEVKYLPEYCDLIVQYFDRPMTRRTVKKKTPTKDGRIQETFEEVANNLPTFTAFAKILGTYTATLYNWRKKYPEFQTAYNECKELQKRMIVNLALKGTYNSNFAIFSTKNLFDWKDKQEATHDFNVKFSLSDVHKKAIASGKQVIDGELVNTDDTKANLLK